MVTLDIKGSTPSPTAQKKRSTPLRAAAYRFSSKAEVKPNRIVIAVPEQRRAVRNTRSPSSELHHPPSFRPFSPWPRRHPSSPRRLRAAAPLPGGYSEYRFVGHYRVAAVGKRYRRSVRPFPLSLSLSLSSFSWKRLLINGITYKLHLTLHNCLFQLDYTYVKYNNRWRL